MISVSKYIDAIECRELIGFDIQNEKLINVVLEWDVTSIKAVLVLFHKMKIKYRTLKCLKTPEQHLKQGNLLLKMFQKMCSMLWYVCTIAPDCQVFVFWLTSLIVSFQLESIARLLSVFVVDIIKQNLSSTCHCLIIGYFE